MADRLAEQAAPPLAVDEDEDNFTAYALLVLASIVAAGGRLFVLGVHLVRSKGIGWLAFLWVEFILLLMICIWIYLLIFETQMLPIIQNPPDMVNSLEPQRIGEENEDGDQHLIAIPDAQENQEAMQDHRDNLIYLNMMLRWSRRAFLLLTGCSFILVVWFFW